MNAGTVAHAARALALPEFADARGNGGEDSCEFLNPVNGRRTVSDIRAWLTAEPGPVPLDYVREYLRALEAIDAVLRRAAPE